VQSKREPVLPKAIETTPNALVLILEGKSVSILWEVFQTACPRFGDGATSSSIVASGYGIHWPLIDEDLTVGLLL
jgi:hypothetical protein